MKRCVIVGGADIRNYDAAVGLLKPDDYVIFCDSGLKHMEKLGVKPGLIVGDFDSHENPKLPVETVVLPCIKDDTDSVFAAKEAVRRGFDEFLFLGVIGGRLDHTIGNVSVLLKLHSLGKKAVIADDYGLMQVIGAEGAEIDDTCRFFSLLNIDGTAKHINVTGAKYPVTDGEITTEYQYGISNEVLPGQTARVTVGEGRLLLIEIRQE